MAATTAELSFPRRASQPGVGAEEKLKVGEEKVNRPEICVAESGEE
jgi:hypothetical protein